VGDPYFATLKRNILYSSTVSRTLSAPPRPCFNRLLATLPASSGREPRTLQCFDSSRQMGRAIYKYIYTYTLILIIQVRITSVYFFIGSNLSHRQVRPSIQHDRPGSSEPCYASIYKVFFHQRKNCIISKLSTSTNYT
jgi:hypothetical protein